MDPVAVYVHVPFCPSKCGYCDFNSFALERLDPDIMARTTAAIRAEILASPFAGRPAKTIFFGGGTPTYLPAEGLISLLDAVRKVHPPVEDCEISSEANPGTVDATKFGAMRAAGFNRISLGAQSFDNDDLFRLERVHKSDEIDRAVSAAREAGFENLNLDLMFALPQQSRRAWQKNLEKALSLAPDHISLYCLTIEPNTAFYKRHLRGQIVLPDEETQVEMYDECVRRTAEVGFHQYEISNFALDGKECQHNLEYWHNREYAGYGPGAVGRVGESRTTMIKHPKLYCEAVEAGKRPLMESEPLDEATLRFEQIMLGLRLNDGISADLVDKTGLERVRQRGWVTSDGRVQLTAEGRHFCSEVALELV